MGIIIGGMLNFPIRTITKKSASAQLGRWILQNENLKNKWVEMGFKPRKKILNPNQVKLIVEVFGEP